LGTASEGDELEVLVKEVLPRIPERTDGKFNIDVYYAGELGIDYDAGPHAVGAGVADIYLAGWHGFHCGDLPILGLTELPMLISTLAQAQEANDFMRPYWERWYLDTYNVQIIDTGVFPSIQMPATTRAIDNLLDWDGIKIRGPGLGRRQFLEAMNASVTETSFVEVYGALQLGVVDGVLMSTDGFLRANWFEHLTHVYVIPVMIGDHLAYVNPDSYAELPDSYRKVLIEVFDEYHELMAEAAREGTYSDDDLAWLAGAGLEIVYPSYEVLSTMRSRMAPIWDEWASEIGGEAPAVLARVKAIAGIK
jgi:TRAP-type C4-dicarboxylate transport system substrate-binding protein